MVVDLPIPESSAYEAGPTIDKGYKEKEANKDKRSAKLENVEDLPDYKNAEKGKIDQEENNNKSKTSSYAFTSSISVLENVDKCPTREISKASNVKTDKLLIIKETSICISTSTHHNETKTEQKEKDLKIDNYTAESSLEILSKSNDNVQENPNECVKDGLFSNSNCKTKQNNECNNGYKDDKRVTPGQNFNAPLFIPSKQFSISAPENTVYAMKEPCIYYPTYPSYYDTTHHVSYNYNRNSSINVNVDNQESIEQFTKQSQANEENTSIDNVAKDETSNTSNKDCTNEKEDKLLSVEKLPVIKSKKCTSESHYTNMKNLKEDTNEMADVSVEGFSPSHYESQDGDCSGSADLQDSYSLTNSDTDTFLPSHPVFNPIPGNHGDLFINPALAAQALQAHGIVHPDPSAFMSFLSPDGSLVGPLGEIYCPPPDYFLMDQSGDVQQGGLVSSPQGNNSGGKTVKRPC